MAEELEVPDIKLGKYRHYKGGEYEVIGTAINTETNEPLVIYKPLYQSEVNYWARPYAMFIETVEVGGKVMARFEKSE